jgi:hypothetical protein
MFVTAADAFTTPFPSASGYTRGRVVMYTLPNRFHSRGDGMRFLLISLAALALYAQVERASIVGTVTDKTGASIPGADIRVTNETTNTSLGVSTTESGDYSAPNLIPGSYTITAQKQGFSRSVVKSYR